MSDIVRQAAGTSVVCRSDIEIVLVLIGNKQVLCVTRVDMAQFRIDRLTAKFALRTINYQQETIMYQNIIKGVTLLVTDRTGTCIESPIAQNCC